MRALPDMSPLCSADAPTTSSGRKVILHLPESVCQAKTSDAAGRLASEMLLEIAFETGEARSVLWQLALFFVLFLAAAFLTLMPMTRKSMVV